MREAGGGGTYMSKINRYKLSIIKQMSERFEMYNVGNIVINFVISLYSDI